jgi:hypothetical protein
MIFIIILCILCILYNMLYIFLKNILLTTLWHFIIIKNRLLIFNYINNFILFSLHIIVYAFYSSRNTLIS